MKTIDKYLLSGYLTPVFYCLAAFCMIYVLSDLSYNFSEFTQNRVPLRAIALYYLAFLPAVNGPCSFLLVIVPISLLAAELFALYRLTRNNELTAMRAGGISLYRVTCPFLAVGLACTVLTAAVQEWITPWSSYWTFRFRTALKGHGHDEGTRTLVYRNAVDGREWFVVDCDTRRPRRLRQVEITEQRPDGGREEIHADQAEWMDGAWWFFGVVVKPYDAAGHAVRDSATFGPLARWPSPRIERMEMRHIKETPDDFLMELKIGELQESQTPYLSSVELVRFLKARPGLSGSTAASYRVTLHVRLAMPWTCLLATLLGIPAGARTGKHGAMVGVLGALGLFFAYYAMVYLGVGLGKAGVLWPWLAAWAPNVAFLVVGLAQVHRMR